MNDSEYYPIWQQAVSTQQPFAQAVQAGQVADNPSTLFIAGYQAAIRATFPELVGEIWYTFAVSEDRSPESTRPGVELEGGRVNGFKTWIAAANMVDQLVLKVGSGAAATYGKVDAKLAQVKMSTKDKPGFLADMSQGQAQFVDAVFMPLLKAENVGRFHEFEPYYIYVALMARIQALAIPDLSERAAGVLEQQQLDNDLLAMDTVVGEMLQAMAEQGVTLGEQWDTDRRLFTMYSKRIQTAAH